MATCEQVFDENRGWHDAWGFEPGDYYQADEDLELLATYTGKAKALVLQLKKLASDFHRHEANCPAFEVQFDDFTEYMGRFSHLADQGIKRLDAIVADAKAAPYRAACADIEDAIMEAA